MHKNWPKINGNPQIQSAPQIFMTVPLVEAYLNKSPDCGLSSCCFWKQLKDHIRCLPKLVPFWLKQQQQPPSFVICSV